jgi:hypothetical protein
MNTNTQAHKDKNSHVHTITHAQKN